MPSLKLIRAGQQLLNKVNPNIPTNIPNAANYFLNPVKDPQRSYMWEVRFNSPVGEGETIKYYAKTAGIPSTMIEVHKRFYQGIEYGYSGRDVSPRIFRVTFWDNQDLMVYKFFDNWVNMIRHPDTNKKALPENQERDIELVMFDSSDFLVTQRFVISNAFPTEISETTLTYTESGDFTFDVMFNFSTKKLVNGG